VRYWNDAGRDAFDGWGYPVYSFSDTTNPSIAWNIMQPDMDNVHGSTGYGTTDNVLYRWVEPKVYSVSSGNNVWYAITFMPTGPLLCWQLLPDEYSWVNNQVFSAKWSGDLGSDGGTDGPYSYTATLPDGRTITYYMTNDDTYGTRGDPRIWYIGIAGASDEQDRYYMSRSGDDSWMGFHGIYKPVLVILGVGDINPSKLSQWISNVTGYIPPCRLSNTYTISVGAEERAKASLQLDVCIGIGSGSNDRWICLLSNTTNGYYTGVLNRTDPNLALKLNQTDFLLLYLPSYSYTLYTLENNPEAGRPPVFKVVISNPNDYDLVDYQVKINLAGTRVANHYLRVYNDTSYTHELPFVYEYSNGECGTEPSSIIWVKVPYIPAKGSITIYIIPTNSSPEWKPSDVFDFYDDFNNYTSIGQVLVNWQKVSGTWALDNGILKTQYSGNNELDHKTYTISNGVIEVRWMKQGSTGGGEVLARIQSDRRAYIADAGVRYELALGYDYDTDTNRRDYSVLASIGSTSNIVQNVWYRIIFKLKGYNLKATLIREDTGDIIDLSAVHSTLTTGKIGFYGYYPNQCFDWIRVRKYADTEPYVVIEEMSS